MDVSSIWPMEGEGAALTDYSFSSHWPRGQKCPRSLQEWIGRSLLTQCRGRAVAGEEDGGVWQGC